MKNNLRKGFTIIEVSLVLAIAGLIFLMVFVALPGLRASQRDTDRRESIMSFLEEVKNYQKNNRGALPGTSDDTGNTTVMVEWSEGLTGSNTTWAGFYKDYLGERFMDADGTNYKLVVFTCDVSEIGEKCKNSELNNLYDGEITKFPNDYKLLVVLRASCNGNEAVATKNPRKLAVLYKLEGAGVYCNNT